MTKQIITKNIFLIGFMGTGKSTIGRALCDKCQLDLLEMDETIEAREKMPIFKIFEKKGEAYFRQLETNLLIEIQKRRNLVISCGGGVPMREENVLEMKKNGKIILLTATSETIFGRVKDSHNRPLLEHNMTVSYIKELMEKRREKYEAASDVVIWVDNKSVDEVCEEILAQI